MNGKISLSLLAVLALSLVGCCCDRCGKWSWGHCCDDFPSGAIAQPLGSYTCSWQKSQAELANQENYVIFRREWVGDSLELSQGGKRHLGEVLPAVMEAGQVLVVEETADSELDARRRDHLVIVLAKMEIPEPDQRVVIGYPLGEGLYGFNAPAIRSGIQGGRGTGGSRFGGANSGLGGGFGGGFTSGGVGGGYGGFGGYN
ncbi:hypothetical protein [Blastopirellula retiformator]|uniref:Uncharacterized protein n=1 Tax=Blastopirellula retiformator TaxID=2527970 RepID=A0A5C5V9B8_9BACT|nr:hypothetical protein [Blastopirellula retiformator]TWT34620.1 hypothetical protein Enr8_20330 [Blastopirellula retiformator]